MKHAVWVAMVWMIACKSDAVPPSSGSAPMPGVAAPPAGSPAPSRPVAPPADPNDGILVAGRDDATKQFFIARVGPKGVTPLFHDTSEPAQLLWVDDHLLIAMFDAQRGRSEDYDVVLRWFVDGQPSDKRGKGGEPISASAWPEGFRRPSTRLLFTRSGQVWLGRKSFGADAHPDKSMYMRVDAMPRKLQREPPADLDLLRSNLWPISRAYTQDDVRARRELLPRPAHGPDGYALALKQAAGGVPGAECRDGKRELTWPTAATHPFLRIHVADARWLSSALPLWIAVGHNPDFPDGDIEDEAAFLGCAKEPLSELRWLGGDAWATLEAGMWRDPKDAKRWTLWNGATKLAVTDATSVVFAAAPL